MMCIYAILTKHVRKFWGRYDVLIEAYEITLSRINHGILDFNLDGHFKCTGEITSPYIKTISLFKTNHGIFVTNFACKTETGLSLGTLSHNGIFVYSGVLSSKEVPSFVPSDC